LNNRRAKRRRATLVLWQSRRYQPRPIKLTTKARLDVRSYVTSTTFSMPLSGSVPIFLLLAIVISWPISKVRGFPGHEWPLHRSSGHLRVRKSTELHTPTRLNRTNCRAATDYCIELPRATATNLTMPRGRPGDNDGERAELSVRQFAKTPRNPNPASNTPGGCHPPPAVNYSIPLTLSP
jgi:hypothetical protein